jgi:hypothetical protein
MSVADWYKYKAEQCTRLAKAVTNPLKRTSLMEEAALWRGIARDVARQDASEAPPLRGPVIPPSTGLF